MEPVDNFEEDTLTKSRNKEKGMKVFSLTDVGKKREINQDSVFASDEPIGNIPNLFVVADGMGRTQSRRLCFRVMQ